MSTQPVDIASAEVGERLRIARESAGLKQADAASAINIARTTLIAIEQGQRRIRVPELQRLSRLYRTTVNALLRQESVHVNLAPLFRKHAGSNDDASVVAIKLLTDLAGAEVELENLLGIRRTRNYPPERRVLPGNVQVQAEQDALELRQWLGLGASPIPDIVTLLDLEMGVRVYVRRLDSRISGLFAYNELLGPCILLNANHPRVRRTQTAAHECGHFVSTRREPDILRTDESERSRRERYANAFGRAFLMPSRSVMQKFHEVIAGSDRLTRRHVIILAHFFGVSREATVRRLEELGLAKLGAWDWFVENGGITDEQERQVLGDLRLPDIHKAEADRPTTLRLHLMAAEAYRQEILSESQLASLLHLDRIELRELLDGLEMDGSEADGVPNLPD